MASTTPRARARAFFAAHPHVPFVVGAVALALVTYWPTRALPYHWDGASFVIEVSRDLLATHFTPFLAAHSDYAHSPLFSAFLAVVWTLFGDSRLVSHALNIPFLLAAMIGVYAIGVRVHGRLLGAVAAFLFAVAPIVQEEYGQIYIDLPMAAFVTCAIAAWLAERLFLATVLMCVAVAIKMPAISTAAALVLSALLLSDQRRQWPRYLVLLAPLAVLAEWIAYHRAVTGWLFIRPGVEETPVRTLSNVAYNARVIGAMLFGVQGRPVLLAAGLAALLFVVARRPGALAVRPLLPLALCVVGGYAFFVASGLFALRYAIFFLPALLVLALAPIRVALDRPLSFALIGLVFGALFVFDWRPRRPLTAAYDFRPDDDLGYLDMIHIGERAARFVRASHPDALVFGAFPESYQLTEPYQGYVDSPARFAECAAFPLTPDDGRERLVYVHPYSQGQITCRALAVSEGGTPIRRFESHDKWLEVWRLPDRGR